jgi:hypothetical protein
METIKSTKSMIIIAGYNNSKLSGSNYIAKNTKKPRNLYILEWQYSCKSFSTRVAETKNSKLVVFNQLLLSLEKSICFWDCCAEIRQLPVERCIDLK